MPGPAYVPKVGANEAKNPHWATDPRRYEVEQERWRHTDALYRFGEYTMFVLLWHVVDFEAGIVRRCPTCFLSYGEVARAYGQTANSMCKDCYGTTFQGGYRAKIVRPAIWDIGAERQSKAQRGEVVLNTAQIQSTPDFKLKIGDYAFRGDGTRWQIKSLGVNRLNTGFETLSDAHNLLAYNAGEAALEDPSSVSYLILPDETSLKATLNHNAPYRTPADYSRIDDIRPRASLL